MESSKSKFSLGIINIYYCETCVGIHNNERSCPICNGEMKKIGWYENNE